MTRRTRPPAPDRLLTTAEVAAMFRVKPQSVNRWAREGKIIFTRTPGGQRRYRETEIRSFLRTWQ